MSLGNRSFSNIYEKLLWLFEYNDSFLWNVPNDSATYQNSEWIEGIMHRWNENKQEVEYIRFSHVIINRRDMKQSWKGKRCCRMYRDTSFDLTHMYNNRMHGYTSRKCKQLEMEMVYADVLNCSCNTSCSSRLVFEEDEKKTYKMKNRRRRIRRRRRRRRMEEKEWWDFLYKYKITSMQLIISSFSSFHPIFLYPSILYHSYPISPSILLTDGSFNSSRRINSILSF